MIAILWVKVLIFQGAKPIFNVGSLSKELLIERHRPANKKRCFGVRICHAQIKFHLPSKPVLSLEGFLFEIDEE